METQVDEQGRFAAKMPKGLKGMLSLHGDEHHALRIRASKNAPLSNSRDLELGVLDHDMMDITVVRYQAPMLLVKAVTEDGTPIKGFRAKIKYQPGREPHGEWIRDGKPAGDVVFERQGDGRWRTEQLLPDEEFTVTVEAEGYQPQSEKLKLAEGAVKELEARLKPAAPKANDPPGQTSAEEPADEKKSVKARAYTAFAAEPEAGEKVPSSVAEKSVEGKAGPPPGVRLDAEPENGTEPAAEAEFDVTRNQGGRR